MDTRSKRTHKLAIIIITLVVLIPAILLTALYPRMEQAVEKRREEYARLELELEEEHKDNEKYLLRQFPSYVLESLYYMYGEYLEEKGELINYGVLEEYDWNDDYNLVMNHAEYYVDFGDSQVWNSDLDLKKLLNGSYSSMSMKEELKARGLAAVLEVTIGTNGELVKVQGCQAENVYYEGDARKQIEASQQQYRTNTEYYQYDRDLEEEDIDFTAVEPKKVKAIFAVREGSFFVSEREDGFYYDTNTVTLYLEVGALALILILAAIVALAALLLPFIKPLETGWEKPFSISFEWMCVIATLAVCGAVLLFEAMCCFSAHELKEMIPTNSLEFLGFTFSIEQINQITTVLAFFGWVLIFWMEYMVVSSLRQFLCGPVYYVKHRLIGVRFIRWCVRKAKKFYAYVTTFELGDELHKKLLLLVGVNGLIVLVMCFGWVFGAIGCVAYTIVIYVLLRKKLEKVQADYKAVNETVHEMAEGNLSIAVPNNLGMFQNLGDELSRVKDGFAKAVSEEAKSQNMKTELITNVSHDLKTPLTAIITYVDLLKQSNATEEEKQSYIEILGKKSQRLKVLIEDLFEVSKAQSGNVKLNQMNVDVVNLMKQVRTELDDKIADSDVTFRWNLPEEKVVLYLDGQKTYRVFENLLNNILKYAMPYTRAYIDIVETAHDVQIRFRNISTAELDFDVDHLTDRFVRGDASRNSEGSGLGLAIAKSFVELQGGMFQIEVDGDLFKVVLKWNK